MADRERALAVLHYERHDRLPIERFDAGGLDFLRKGERSCLYGLHCGSLFGNIRNIVGIDLVSPDYDGMIDALITTWLNNGVNTMFPVEVGTWNASLAPWREQYGRGLRGVGGMNKNVFARDLNGKWTVARRGCDDPLPACVPGDVFAGLLTSCARRPIRREKGKR